MKITFLGAAHEVTGSCYLIEACGKRMLVDFGMEQGRDIYENQPMPVSSNSIDYVFLTHAHIDHSGKLPMLYKEGFRGMIFSTSATGDLADIMLRDSAHIQETEAQWRSRKAARAGEKPYEPLYTTEDAVGTAQLFARCDYGKMIQVTEDVKIRFTDVGHLLGSASIEVWLRENGVEKKLVFSGDLGNINQPILHDPQTTDEADYVVIESTYGDRLHDMPPDYVSGFAQIIDDVMKRGGNLVIPSFAVGRTQELLYFIREIKQRGLVKSNPDFRVYVDSPLAVEATQVFNKNTEGYMDEDAMALIEAGINPLQFPGLSLSVTTDESRMLNTDAEPKVIISASGMCEAGRIRHHLKHNLWRSECSVLFVGFQSPGTLGEQLLSGAKSIKLFGETVNVAAKILNLDGVSGHADRDGLIRWARGFKNKPAHVFVTHGEDEVTDTFAKTLSDELGMSASAPYNGECWDLASGELVCEGNKKPIPPKDGSAQQAKKPDPSSAFGRLLAAIDALRAVASKNQQLANKQLERFTDEVSALADRWN